MILSLNLKNSADLLWIVNGKSGQLWWCHNDIAINYATIDFITGIVISLTFFGGADIYGLDIAFLMFDPLL